MSRKTYTLFALIWAFILGCLVMAATPAHAQDAGYYAQKTYTSSGAATYSVPFPYVRQADVLVYDNGVAYSGTVSWSSSTVISLSPVIATGHTVLVKRSTSTTPAATFNGGAIASTDLNRNQLQTIYLGQEALDSATAANATAASAVVTAGATSASATAAAASASTASSAATAAAASAAAAATFTPSLYVTKAGITSGVAPSAGSIGEVICSQVWQSGSPTGCGTNTTTGVSLTSAAEANITSISVTAGYWEITGQFGCFSTGGGLVSIVAGAINTVSATRPGFGVPGTVFLNGISGNIGMAASLGTRIVNLTSTTTYYLVGRCDVAAGAITGYGSIYARRIG